MNSEFKTWLDEYIEQMECEVQENEDEKDRELSLHNDKEYHYFIGTEHGEQQGVLSTLKLIKDKLREKQC